MGLWQLIIHDWSKFTPREFFPYAHFWDGGRKDEDKYYAAWQAHMLRNPHHWQNWLLVKEGGEIVPLDMPRKYIKEMLADWSGAQRVYQGGWSPRTWYYERRWEIILHPDTRFTLEYLMDIYFWE